jgi:hypothetical protein
MSLFPDNPWGEGRCCEGDLMQDAAHIWAACQNPGEAYNSFAQTEIFKVGEALTNAVDESRMRHRPADDNFCRDFYMLCEDVTDKETLASFLHDMGVLDYLDELRPEAARQIRKALED